MGVVHSALLGLFASTTSRMGVRSDPCHVVSFRCVLVVVCVTSVGVIVRGRDTEPHAPLASQELGHRQVNEASMETLVVKFETSINDADPKRSLHDIDGRTARARCGA